MKQSIARIKQVTKQRITVFLDPIIVKRSKLRGILEGLTVSETIEKALDTYAPKIERETDSNINLKFHNVSVLKTTLLATSKSSMRPK